MNATEIQTEIETLTIRIYGYNREMDIMRPGSQGWLDRESECDSLIARRTRLIARLDACDAVAVENTPSIERIVALPVNVVDRFSLATLNRVESMLIIATGQMFTDRLNTMLNYVHACIERKLI